jgi:hypothetical protein
LQRFHNPMASDAQARGGRQRFGAPPEHELQFNGRPVP